MNMNRDHGEAMVFSGAAEADLLDRRADARRAV